MVSATVPTVVSVPLTGMNGGLKPSHWAGNGVFPENHLWGGGRSSVSEGRSASSWTATTDHSPNVWCWLLEGE